MPPSRNAAVNFIDFLVRDVVNSKVLEYRPSSLRASSAPFCPVLNYLDKENKELGSESDYKSDFYFASGTAFHENVAQKHFPNSTVGRKSVVGDWKCLKCQLAQPFSKKPECKEKFCHIKYDEIEVYYHGNSKKQILSGHIDLIVEFQNTYIIGDFKTTSEEALKWRKSADPKHIIQLEIYAYLVEYLYKVEVSYLTVLYVPRNRSVDENGKPLIKSFIITWSNERRKLVKKRIDRWQRGYKASENSNIPLIVKLRPCRSKQDFTDEMAPAFYKSVCPHLKTCCAGDKAVEKLLKGHK